MTHHFLSLAPDNATSLADEGAAAAAAAAACKVNTEAAGDGGSIPDLNVASVEEEEQPQPQPQAAQEAELQKGFGSSSSPWQLQAGRTSSSGSTKVVVEPPDWLPQGWIAEVRTREGGSKDKYYFEPVSGRRFRSKVEVLKYLEASKWRADEAAAGAMAANGALLGCGHAKSPVTSLKEAADRLPFLMQSGLDDLRNILAKGPPPLPSHGFHDYWNSSSGRSSWTDYFKLNSSAGGDSSNGASSSLLQSASGTTSATPHWLDRILNKGPPVQPPPSSSAGTTDGFVQSPLHYLHNAGAFHNSWLHIKPPTQNTAYTTGQSAGGDAPWKPSWSWLESASARSKSRDDSHRSAGDTKRPEINLNQAFDPDDEDCWPEARDEDRKAPWKPAEQPAGRALESLWEKAVPITLEHREFISPHPNGASAAAAAVQAPQPQQHSHQHQHHHQHQHQHQHQQQQHRLSKEGVHFDVLGVRRTSQNKLDRHQEKKRMENLGKTLCKQSGARLLLELKDRSSRLSMRQ